MEAAKMETGSGTTATSPMMTNKVHKYLADLLANAGNTYVPDGRRSYALNDPRLDPKKAARFVAQRLAELAHGGVR